MRKLFRYLIPLCSLGLILYSGWNLWAIHQEYKAGTDLYESVADTYTKPRIYGTRPDYAVEGEASDGLPLQVNFESLQTNNPDVVAWIYSPGTVINYPIVQSGDNSYYLRRMLNGRYNKNGSIFMDYRNASDLSDLHTIVYGHNMKNSAMFGTLTQYKDPAYYEQHPILWLLTPDGAYQIELIGGFTTPSDSNIYVFPDTAKGRDRLVSFVQVNSDFTTDVEIGPDDRLVTLSTCTYDYDDARYVVTGVLRPYIEENKNE